MPEKENRTNNINNKKDTRRHRDTSTETRNLNTAPVVHRH